jgi:hypothetical protein
MATDPLAEFRANVPAEHWRTVLTVVSESMECAHQHGPDRWGVRVNRSLILKVGPHEVLQIGQWPQPCHLIVTSELVPADLRANNALKFSGNRDSRENRGQSGYHASQDGTEVCDFDFADLETTYRHLRHAHFEAIARAASLRRHPSTARSHSADFVELAASITGKRLSQPTHGRSLKEHTHEWSVSLTAAQYVSGLRAIESKMSDTQRALLVGQYGAESRTVYASQLAIIAKVRGGHPAVNAQYGRLGHMFCDATGFLADREGNDRRWWAVWSRGRPTSKGYIWEMLPAVAVALESLGWVVPIPPPDSRASDTEWRGEQSETVPPWRTGTTAPKSEEGYVRSPTTEREVNPDHNRLQNELFRRLCVRYGPDAVILEEGFADVKLRIEDGSFHLFEIKPDQCPTAAIRPSLGQLLEYSFSAMQRGERISAVIVAAPGHLKKREIRYVEFLKATLSLPFHYLQLDEHVTIDSYRTPEECCPTLKGRA